METKETEITDQKAAEEEEAVNRKLPVDDGLRLKLVGKLERVAQVGQRDELRQQPHVAQDDPKGKGKGEKSG